MTRRLPRHTGCVGLEDIIDGHVGMIRWYRSVGLPKELIVRELVAAITMDELWQDRLGHANLKLS